MQIRNAFQRDTQGILQVCEQAFPAEEAAAISQLARELLALSGTPPTLSLVADIENAPAGYVSFSPLTLAGATDLSAYLLAPLAVLPDRQKQGIGSALVRQGLQRLEQDGVNLVLVYGDPDYYGRFGFGPAIGRLFQAPFPLTYPFGWLGLTLQPLTPDFAPIPITCVGPLNRAELW